MQTRTGKLGEVRVRRLISRAIYMMSTPLACWLFSIPSFYADSIHPLDMAHSQDAPLMTVTLVGLAWIALLIELAKASAPKRWRCLACSSPSPAFCVLSRRLCPCRAGSRPFAHHPGWLCFWRPLWFLDGKAYTTCLGSRYGWRWAVATLPDVYRGLGRLDSRVAGPWHKLVDSFQQRRAFLATRCGSTSWFYAYLALCGVCSMARSSIYRCAPLRWDRSSRPGRLALAWAEPCPAMQPFI